VQSGRQVLTVAQQHAVSVKENRTFDLMGRKLRNSNLHFREGARTCLSTCDKHGEGRDKNELGRQPYIGLAKLNPRATKPRIEPSGSIPGAFHRYSRRSTEVQLTFQDLRPTFTYANRAAVGQYSPK
jgi:hypothetical protein